MQGRLDAVVRLGKVVDHVCGSAPVHTDRGEGVPGDLLLRWQNCYMGEAIKSK